MKTGIKISHLLQVIKTKVYNVLRKPSASNVAVRFANLDHESTLSSFDDKVRQNFWAKIVQEKTRSVPSVYRSAVLVFTGPSVPLLFLSPENICEPVSKAFITAYDSKLTMPLRAVPVSSLFNIAKIKASLTVDYACYVGNLFVSLIGGKRYKLSHIDPFVEYGSMINERVIYVHRKRLSVLDSKEYATV